MVDRESIASQRATMGRLMRLLRIPERQMSTEEWEGAVPDDSETAQLFETQLRS